MDSGYGTDSCPWLIQAQPGQRINITLLDFAIDTETKPTRPIDYCRAYAIIRDHQTGRSTTVCGGHVRESVVYLSQSNSVEVRIIRTAKRDDVDHFLLKYESKSADYDPPPARSVISYVHVSLESDRFGIETKRKSVFSHSYTFLILDREKTVAIKVGVVS